jgi:hypothetical protein
MPDRTSCCILFSLHTCYNIWWPVERNRACFWHNLHAFTASFPWRLGHNTHTLKAIPLLLSIKCIKFWSSTMRPASCHWVLTTLLGLHYTKDGDYALLWNVSKLFTGCNIQSSGLFPGVWVLKADVSAPSVSSIFKAAMCEWWQGGEVVLIYGKGRRLEGGEGPMGNRGRGGSREQAIRLGEG